MAADDLVQKRGVQHVVRARAHLVERRRTGDHAVARHATVGRLHTDGAGQGCRLADGAAGVGADAQRCLTGRERRRGAAAGAARDALEVVRVLGLLVGGVLRGRAHGELVQVGLTQNRDASGAQLRHHGGVVRAHVALEHLGRGGGRRVGGHQQVFERQRHARERGGRLIAVFNLLVHLVRRGKRFLGADVQEGAELAVDLSDAVEEGLRDLAGGDVAGLDHCGELVRWLCDETIGRNRVLRH